MGDKGERVMKIILQPGHLARPEANRLPVGQIGYFLPGKPDIWRGALLGDGEEEFIYDCPRLVGGGKMLNLGDGKGGSAILIAQGLRDKKLEGQVYTVDCYESIQKTESVENMEKADVYEYIKIFRKTTAGAARIFSKRGEKFNFIFVDADHSYGGFKFDWKTFSTMLEEGGIIALHDTNQTFVDKVIKEEISEEEWINIFWINRIKAFIRKKDL
jgi:hypothetical protein